jgi:16S rRNA processing protein RimM
VSRPDWIEVGRISRAHGVHGEVRLTPDSDNPERFVPGAVLYARPGRAGLAVPAEPQQIRLTVEDVRGHGAFPIVAFQEVPDRNQAEALSGYILEVPSTELPDLDEDEFYPFDLQGLEVRLPDGTVAGRVVEAVESPAHAILIVGLTGGREVMLPFVEAVVPEVDVPAGFVVVVPSFLEA